jgi:hypothetical protein
MGKVSIKFSIIHKRIKIVGIIKRNRTIKKKHLNPIFRIFEE